jgi:hypothetical protein
MLALAFQPEPVPSAAPATPAPPPVTAPPPATAPAAQSLPPAPAPFNTTQSTTPRAPKLDDKSVAPDGAPRDADVNYQNRVLSNFQATQGRQGPFDGRWTLSGSAGDMFVLQLTDPGEGGKVEGAWRDLRRNGGGRSGLIDSIVRDGDMVTVRFVEAEGQQPVEVKLRSPQPGGWLGEVSTVEGGRQSIVMHRSSGVETQAMAAPHVAQPPPPRVSRASLDRTPTRGKARRGRHGVVQRRGHAAATSHSRGSQHSTSRSAHAKGSKAHATSSKSSVKHPAAKKSSVKKSSATHSTVKKKKKH